MLMKESATSSWAAGVCTVPVPLGTLWESIPEDDQSHGTSVRGAAGREGLMMEGATVEASRQHSSGPMTTERTSPGLRGAQD